jgi:hypothetical protein
VPAGGARVSCRTESQESFETGAVAEFRATPMGETSMNAKAFGVLIVAGMAACSVNTTKSTSWAKPGVSMIDYQTDTILCGTLADNVGAGNAANTAGGVNGKNDTAHTGSGGDAAIAAGASGAQSSSTAQSISGGTYSGVASGDYVSRAATQQRTQEMQLKQAKVEALHSCLVHRGYTEFDLTPEQRAELAKLPPGSEQRRDYLYKIGSDPNALKPAASAK